MQVGKKRIDHIVYAVNDLELGIKDMTARLGVAPVFGGYHTTEGTKNALVNLGRGVYLELLAIDLENTNIASPRWMGIDYWTQNQITRWAIKSDNLNADRAFLEQYRPALGITKGGQRKMTNGNMLTWELSMPHTEPEVEIAPFLLAWKDESVHPTHALKASCQLVSLKLYHPNPEKILPTLRHLSIDLPVEPSDRPQIRAVIQCPNGLVEI